jgi:hypothetical protein
VISWFFTVFALFITIAAMVTQEWSIKEKTLEEEGGYSLTGTLHAGLRTYTVKTANGTETGSLSEPTRWIPSDEATQLLDGGKFILTLGVVGLFLAAAAAVLLPLIHFHKINRKFSKYGRHLIVAAGCCNMGGMLCYADKINAGYSYIAFTVAALFFFLASAIIVFKEERLWHVLATVLVITAILCTIVSMATNYWVQDSVQTHLYAINGTSIIQTTTVELNIGLKKFTNQTTITNGTDGSQIWYSKNSGSLNGASLPFGYDAAFLSRGGNFVLITGSVGLFLATASLGLLFKAETGMDALGPRGALGLWQYVQISGKKGKYFLFALLMLMWTGTFSMVGTLLYASELNLKYSYELFTGASIVYFLAGAILVSREDEFHYVDRGYPPMTEAQPLKREVGSDYDENSTTSDSGAGDNHYAMSSASSSNVPQNTYSGFAGGQSGGTQSAWGTGLDSR